MTVHRSRPRGDDRTHIVAGRCRVLFDRIASTRVYCCEWDPSPATRRFIDSALYVAWFRIKEEPISPARHVSSPSLRQINVATGKSI
jgi:hypothetical protein